MRLLDLVFTRIDKMGADFKEMLDEDRAARASERTEHSREHERDRQTLHDYQRAQAATCAELMKPYQTLGPAFKLVGWIGCHPKWAAGIGSVLLASATVAGGLLLPGR